MGRSNNFFIFGLYAKFEPLANGIRRSEELVIREWKKQAGGEYFRLQGKNRFPLSAHRFLRASIHSLQMIYPVQTPPLKV